MRVIESVCICMKLVLCNRDRFISQACCPCVTVSAQKLSHFPAVQGFVYRVRTRCTNGPCEKYHASIQAYPSAHASMNAIFHFTYVLKRKCMLFATAITYGFDLANFSVS